MTDTGQARAAVEFTSAWRRVAGSACPDSRAQPPNRAYLGDGGRRSHLSRNRRGILLVLGVIATSGRGLKVAYVANVVSGVTIDCVDPQRVARFWSALLGREPGPSQNGWVYLGHRCDPQPRLVFQPVPEPKAGKVRIHIDVTVDNVERAIELVTSLGGRTTGERHDYDEGAVVVMADPEGHEFCLVQYY